MLGMTSVVSVDETLERDAVSVMCNSTYCHVNKNEANEGHHP